MKSFLFLFYFFVVFTTNAANVTLKAGQLIEYNLIQHLSKNDLDNYYKEHKIPLSIFPIQNEIDIYEIIYTTTYYDSSIIKVSGLVYVPKIKDKIPYRLLYTHGTQTCTYNGPLNGERAICIVFAADEYIVIAPDYIGLGKSELAQLYLHEYAESHTSVDMLIASESLLSKINVATEKNIFVAGYSQGGHAAMATHRLLQNEYKNQYTVTASAPMSGPYDVEGSIFKGINQPYIHPSLLILFLKTYCIVNNKPDTFEKILTAPYNTLVPPYLDGNYPFWEIDKLLPSVAAEMVTKDFVKEFANNPQSQFRTYTHKNNVYDWKPEAPMQMCYCEGDKDVNYKNTLKAYETMKKNGSNKVLLKRAGKKFGHVNCALFATAYTKLFFDGYKNGRPGYEGKVSQKLLINVLKIFIKP